MKLYLVCAVDEDGESMDLFVRAETPSRAIELWRAGLIDIGHDETCAAEMKYTSVYEVPAVGQTEGYINWADLFCLNG